MKIRYVELETAGRGGDLDSVPAEIDWPDNKPIPEGAEIISDGPPPIPTITDANIGTEEK